MRWSGRRNQEYDWQADLAARSALDWQADLAARSALAGSQSDTATPAGERESTRRIRLVFWRLIKPLAIAASLGAAIVGRHHPVGVVLAVLWVCLWPLESAAARRRKREREKMER